MNYELAKQLKDAGFPQGEPNGFPGILNPDGDKDVYYPSLTELIEACGDSFYALIWGRGTVEGIWFASSMTSPEFKIETASKGDSAEEALAKLWLELNKK